MDLDGAADNLPGQFIEARIVDQHAGADCNRCAEQWTKLPTIS
jgi:hypothetical protein